MADRFDKFTEPARKVLQHAQAEAQRFNHNYIATEHLLLGMIHEDGGLAAKVLANLGVELNKVRSAVEFIIGRGDRKVTGDVGLTPRAKKMIELSVDEARRLNHSYIGTEHLLLALVREGEGIAAGILESLDVPLDTVRDHVIYVLGRWRSEPRYYRPGLPPIVARLSVELRPTRSIAEAVELLSGLRERLETLHRVEIGDDVLKAAAELSALFIADGSLPERAADVVDDAAALARGRHAPIDYGETRRDLERALQEREAAIATGQYDPAAEHHETVKRLRDTISEIEAAWLHAPVVDRPVVTVDDVIQAISARTRIAASDVAERYRGLRDPDGSQS